MNKYITPTSVLLVFVVGFLWLKAYDAGVRDRALAEARYDSIQAITKTSDSLVVELTDRDAELLARQDTVERVVIMTRTEYQTLIDTLTIRDTVTQYVINACNAALSACDSLNIVYLSRLALKDSVLTAQGEALDAVRVALKEQRHDPWHRKVTRTAPYVLGAFLLGYAFGK